MLTLLATTYRFFSAWHGFKYIDPAESGAVIPIVHVNGFKISERTIYGTMDDKEITALFTGYGYQVRFVEDLDNIDQDMAASMGWALSEIHKIQKDARSGNPQVKPRWPVLIMRTPKVSSLCPYFFRQTHSRLYVHIGMGRAQKATRKLH
jgi:phosphoketolase